MALFLSCYLIFFLVWHLLLCCNLLTWSVEKNSNLSTIWHEQTDHTLLWVLTRQGGPWWIQIRVSTFSHIIISIPPVIPPVPVNILIPPHPRLTRFQFFSTLNFPPFASQGPLWHCPIWPLQISSVRVCVWSRWHFNSHAWHLSGHVELGLPSSEDKSQ